MIGYIGLDEYPSQSKEETDAYITIFARRQGALDNARD